MTATLTLDLAETLLRTELPVMRGRWPRAVALLTRQSLEETMGELWTGSLPAMAATSARAQLLCLPAYLADDETAEAAAHAWGWLSQACHHRVYELAPNAVELTRAIETVRRLITAVHARLTGAIGKSPNSHSG